jgi:hypothetical protein
MSASIPVKLVIGGELLTDAAWNRVNPKKKKKTLQKQIHPLMFVES